MFPKNLAHAEIMQPNIGTLATKAPSALQLVLTKENKTFSQLIFLALTYKYGFCWVLCVYAFFSGALSTAKSFVRKILHYMGWESASATKLHAMTRDSTIQEAATHADALEDSLAAQCG